MRGKEGKSTNLKVLQQLVIRFERAFVLVFFFFPLTAVKSPADGDH